MAITFEQVSSWADIDFDELFEASVSNVDNDFFSQAAGIITIPDKKEYYRSQIQSAFDGTWEITKPGETLMFFKGVYDGITMEFWGGYLEDDGVTLRAHWYLTRPDAQGSRNSIHTAETAALRRSFYLTHGITKYKVMTYVGSVLYRWLKTRINSGAVIAISETSLERQGPVGEAHVTFHLEA